MNEEVEEIDELTPSESVTYCPEDNKLRLYVGRVPRDEYEALRSGGWVSTPKQDCDFVAVWSVSREDQARDYLDEGEDIGDEDYSPQERAADRAERFGEYREKRRAEAGGLADSFDAGPAAHGHQSQAKADRAARKHDRQRTGAVSQWQKAEYWQMRTAGVIRSALHRSSAHVRRGRILEIERRLRLIEGRDGYTRSREHLNNRLIYERAMLENEGGILGELKIEPGDFVRIRSNWVQVHAVNKSNATGRITSVKVLTCYENWGGIRRDNDGRAVYSLRSHNIERLGEDAYRSPTAEELAKFEQDQKERKAAAKAAREADPKPKLLNPTPEDAAKLQDLAFNADRKEDQKSQPLAITQAQYTANSKGYFNKFETVLIGEKCRPIRNSNFGNSGGPHTQRREVFKVRICRDGYNASRVIIITDKKQHAIPFEAIEAARAMEPTEDSIGRDLAKLFSRRTEWGYEFLDLPEDERKAARQLRSDAGYLGLANITCANQFDPTEAGCKLLDKWRAIIASESEPEPKAVERSPEAVAAGRLF